MVCQALAASTAAPGWLKEAAADNAAPVLQLVQVIDDQLSAIADNISDFQDVVVAYEPVWAIGTGKVPPPGTMPAGLFGLHASCHPQRSSVALAAVTACAEHGNIR